MSVKSVFDEIEGVGPQEILKTFWNSRKYKQLV